MFAQKIMDEEFPEYQKLLDGMEIEPIPIALTYLSSPGPALITSRQNKRLRATFDKAGEGEI
jgi:hypothetical protein